MELDLGSFDYFQLGCGGLLDDGVIVCWLVQDFVDELCYVCGGRK